jgi:hypothetical protein
MRRVREEDKASGLSGREFGEQRGMALTTLDYWIQEHARKAGKQTQVPRARLVKVEEAAASASVGVFRVSVAKGRRIESCWTYADAERARLIRVVESA